MSRKLNPLPARVRRALEKLEKPLLPRPRRSVATFRVDIPEGREAYERFVNQPKQVHIVSEKINHRINGRGLDLYIAVIYEDLEVLVDPPMKNQSQLEAPSSEAPERSCPTNYYEFSKAQRKHENGS